MIAPVFTKDSLDRLPQDVQAMLDETGLRNTLGALFEQLCEEDIPEDVRAPVVELLDWALTVLATATGPLLQGTFNSLHNDFSWINQHLTSRLLPAEDSIGSILHALSHVPGTRAVHSLETADRVIGRLKNARRNIANTETRLEEAENDFGEFLDTHRTAVAQKAGETTDKLIDAELSISTHHAESCEKMNDLLEDLQERYGFTAQQVLGGAHEGAANAEHRLAESHSLRSRWSMWGGRALGWPPTSGMVFRTDARLGSMV